MWAIKRVEVPGWDAGARTIESMSGDGALTFSVGQSIGIVCGLNGADASPHYREIEHAFHIEARTYRVIESGTDKTAPAPKPPGAVFRIERVAGTIRYFVDGVPIYTSETPSRGIVFGDCSLFANGDAVIDVDLVPVDRTTGVLALGPIGLKGSDAPATFGVLKFRMTLSATEADRTQGILGIGKIGGHGSDKPIVAGTLRLGPIGLEGSDAADILPDYVSGLLGIGPFSGWGADVPATVADGILPIGPLAAIGSDAPIGFGALGLGTVGLGGYALPGAQIVAAWPYWQASLSQFAAPDATEGIGYAFGDLPALEGRATGFRADGAAICILPALIGQAFGGGSSRLDLPALVGEATGRSLGLGWAELDLPALVGEATGLTGAIGSAVLNLPALVGEAFGGGSALFELPALVGEATGLTGAIGSAVLNLPALVGEAFGVSSGIGRALLDLPALIGSAGDGVHVVALLPALVGEATGFFDSSGTVSAVSALYAVNVATAAVTRWTLAPPEKLATAHGRLYGLRDGILYAMDGSEDFGASQVQANIRFAPQNFGVLNPKRPRVVYLDCRENDGVELSVIIDERVEHVYTSRSNSGPGMETHRVKVGQGIKAHTVGVRVKNRNGGKLAIGGLELWVHPFSPKIKS